MMHGKKEHIMKGMPMMKEKEMIKSKKGKKKGKK